MRNIWNWIEDNAGPIMVTIAVLGGFAGIIQFSVVRPMQQGFNAVNQRIDDQNKSINQRIDDQNKSINQRFDDQRFERPSEAIISASTPWTSASTTRTSTSISASTPWTSASTPWTSASTPKTDASRTSLKMSLNFASSATASPATKHASTPSPSSCRPPTHPRPRIESGAGSDPVHDPILNLRLGNVGRISRRRHPTFPPPPPLRNIQPPPSSGPAIIQAEIPALRDTILHDPETLEDLCGKYGTGSKTTQVPSR